MLAMPILLHNFVQRIPTGRALSCFVLVVREDPNSSARRHHRSRKRSISHTHTHTRSLSKAIYRSVWLPLLVFGFDLIIF